MALVKDDVYADIQSVAAGAYLTIRPGASEECLVKFITIGAGGNVQISQYDGTDEAVIKNVSTAQGTYITFDDKGFYVKNGTYLRVKNLGSAAVKIGYAGVATKPLA